MDSPASSALPHPKNLRHRSSSHRSPAPTPAATSSSPDPHLSPRSRAPSNASTSRSTSEASTGGRSRRSKARDRKLKMDIPPNTRDFSATLRVEGSRIKVLAPGTPWNEIDLSESFMATPAVQRRQGLLSRRRLFFIIGGLFGAFLGWLFTEGPTTLSFDDGVFSDFALDSTLSNIRGAVSEGTILSNLGIGFNISDVFQGATKGWLKNTDFNVGRQLLKEGAKKKHAVLLIPGIVSSGLESWSTTEEHAQFFRKRIWGTSSMIRAIVTRKEAWIRAMSLDPDTGLDPPGVKVRAAQGFDAAAYFVQGYWIWQKIIENLAVLDYDHNDMMLAAYDWRLAYINLETRDKYFSRIKMQIEHTMIFQNRKTVLVSHSMGGSVVLFFLKWVEADGYGNGGRGWVEKHVASFVSIAGTTLGVPKAMAALLSGEMRDTVELNPAGVYMLEKLFSRRERTSLFRSWAGSASMWPKGGDELWGTSEGAPDDPEDATLTNGNAYYFRKIDAGKEINAENVSPNMTMNKAYEYLLQHSPSSYQRMLASNYSFGFERDAKQIKSNDQDPTKWTNPLEVQLPNAPSMKIFCLYGVGKATERGYWYKAGPYESDEISTISDQAQCMAEDDECGNRTIINPLGFPLAQQVWVDTEVTLDNESPKVKSGVTVGDGDGTVSVLSLGSMCVRGWKSKLYNPAQIPVITHELKHMPVGLDMRGGATTADHIDILGSAELNEAVLRIAAGQETR